MKSKIRSQIRVIGIGKRDPSLVIASRSLNDCCGEDSCGFEILEAGAVEVPIAVELAVTEGPRAVVNTVTIEGIDAASEPGLRSALGLQAGQPFSASQLSADAQAIELRLANLGYSTSNVGTSSGLSADGAKADVVFTVRQGPRVLVDHVLIVGNERTRTATIEPGIGATSSTGPPPCAWAAWRAARSTSGAGASQKARLVSGSSTASFISRTCSSRPPMSA